MSDVIIPQPESQVTTPAPPVPPAGKSKKNRKKLFKRLLVAGIILAVIAGLCIGMWYLVFRQDETVGAPLTDFSRIGSIQSGIQGSGSARAKEMAAITLSAGGTVREVYVTEGQTVFAGDPLYRIDSQAAEDEVAAAQDRLNNLYRDLEDLHTEAGHLTVRAPFAGKLQEVVQFDLDQDVGKGATIATLVNDKKLKLKLYFSYAYEHEISKGQSASVSIPAVMGNFTGQVEQVNKVSYISPEGAVHFEVVIVFDNPGTLTGGMDASAVLTAGDGSAFYPYQNTKTEFYETRTIVTRAAGPVVGVGTLMNYANVSQGEALLYLGSSSIDSDIRAKQTELEAAQTKLDDAQKALADFNAVAPIDGAVFSCAIQEGQEVKSGDTVITISNTSTMLVDITVDDRNIGFIQPGMSMELTDDWENIYYATVTSLSMEGEVGSGTTTYPVQLTLDNAMGALYPGAWLRYQLTTSQSEDCILIPNQCVKRVTDLEGEIYTVVFVKAEGAPENRIELDPAMLGETMPSPDEGFYPVPVTTGISDTFNVEILEGLDEGVEVFTNRETNQSYGW